MGALVVGPVGALDQRAGGVQQQLAPCLQAAALPLADAVGRDQHPLGGGELLPFLLADHAKTPGPQLDQNRLVVHQLAVDGYARGIL